MTDKGMERNDATVEFLMNRESGGMMILTRDKKDNRVSETIISHMEMLNTIASAILYMKEYGFDTEYDLDDGTHVSIEVSIQGPEDRKE